MQDLKIKFNNFILKYFNQTGIYASPTKRIGSFLIDTLIIATLFNGGLIVASNFGFDYNLYTQEVITNNKEKSQELSLKETLNTQKAKQLSYVFICFSYIYYVLFLTSKKQATIGNQVFRIMVVHTKNVKITLMTAFIRYTLTLLNNYIYWVGCLLYFIRKDKAILQDVLSDTRVIAIKK